LALSEVVSPRRRFENIYHKGHEEKQRERRTTAKALTAEGAEKTKVGINEDKDKKMHGFFAVKNQRLRSE
jgi:hypothetical protein